MFLWSTIEVAALWNTDTFDWIMAPLFSTNGSSSPVVEMMPNVSVVDIIIGSFL